MLTHSDTNLQINLVAGFYSTSPFIGVTITYQDSGKTIKCRSGTLCSDLLYFALPNIVGYDLHRFGPARIRVEAKVKGESYGFCHSSDN
jgi:hypothetical protein